MRDTFEPFRLKPCFACGAENWTAVKRVGIEAIAGTVAAAPRQGQIFPLAACVNCGERQADFFGFASLIADVAEPEHVARNGVIEAVRATSAHGSVELRDGASGLHVSFFSPGRNRPTARKIYSEHDTLEDIRSWLLGDNGGAAPA